MKGSKEILFSAAVALTSLFVLTQATKELKTSRQATPLEPTMIPQATLTMDVEAHLNWGLTAIHAPQAWSGAQSGKVTVAVIDTGCDTHHPDLARNIWTNPGESGFDDFGRDKASNGIDDDDNGFVDDVHGWNFVSNSPVLTDEHGHGTHIAGIIEATSPRVSLMVLKYYDSEATGEANLAHTIEAIRYAVKMGAQIINYSGGGILRNGLEEAAIRYANEHDVVVIAAAGNEGLNSDFFHFYPADYDLPNIVSVTAVDKRGHLLDQANFGRATVDVAAPGRNIYSTMPGGEHGYMSGTSQATAFVTGVASLMMAQDERYRDPRLLIRQLMAHGRSTPQLHDKIGHGQMLDAQMALEPADLRISGLTD